VEEGGHTFLAPAHLPSNYVDTLGDVDRSADPRLVAFRARVQPFLSGNAVDTQVYRADRGCPSPPAPPTSPLDAPQPPNLGDLLRQGERRVQMQDAERARLIAARQVAPTAAAG
jgi:hypothetical protein